MKIANKLHELISGVVNYRNMDGPVRKYDRKDLENAKSEFYQLKGWDVAFGIPSKKKLNRLGLNEVAADLEKRGLLPKPA